jgi:hypothetical protein
MKRLLFVGALLCTSACQPPQEPATTWRLHPAVMPLGTCAVAQAWLITDPGPGRHFGIRLDPASTTSCLIAAEEVSLTVGAHVIKADRLSSPLHLGPTSTILLDVELPPTPEGRAWERSAGDGQLVLRAQIDGEPATATWRVAP